MDAKGQASVFAQSDWFKGEGFNLNGIVLLAGSPQWQVARMRSGFSVGNVGFFCHGKPSMAEFEDCLLLRRASVWCVTWDACASPYKR